MNEPTKLTLPLDTDALVEGPVLAKEPASLYIDLAPYGTGIIYGREFLAAKDVIKKIKIGDIVKSKVIEKENEEGYIELSLQEAREAEIWRDAEVAIKNQTVFELEVKEANKGGLIIEWRGIKGFLPASQLSPDNYPMVMDNDKDKILNELKKLVGKKLQVVMISALPKENKLIFSEKKDEKTEKHRQEVLTKYSVGDEIEGEVAGIVDFGIFVKIEEGLEGLVHISELDWGFVEDPKKMFKIGTKVKAKIIEIKDGKISLSIKALKENPWKEFEGKLKKGDIVSGVVLRYNNHGALIAIKEGVAGLVHNSTFGSEKKLRETLELGKTYNFQVTVFEPKDQKLMFTYVGPNN